MSKKNISIGFAVIIIGLIIYITTTELAPLIYLTIIGILLIIFHGEEDKIEKRRDK